MTKNKIIVGAAALTALIAVVGLAFSSYAAGGKGLGMMFGLGGNEADRQANMEKAKVNQEAMQAAITNNDYNAWKTLMEERKSEMMKKVDEFASKITQETFAKLVEINKLVSEGKNNEANKIRQELGFNLGLGGFMGRPGCHGGGCQNKGCGGGCDGEFVQPQ